MYSESLDEILERIAQGATNAEEESQRADRSRDTEAQVGGELWFDHLDGAEKAAYYAGRSDAYAHARDLLQRYLDANEGDTHGGSTT